MYAGCLLLTVAPVVLSGERSGAERLTAVAAVAVLSLTAFGRHRGDRALVWTDALDPLALFAAGVVLGPEQVGPVLFTGAQLRALYGGPRSTLGAVGLSVACLLAAGAAAAPSTLPRLTQAVPSAFATALVLNLLARAVRRYEDGSEARLQALVSASSDVIALVAADHSLVYLSPSARRVFGYGQPAAPGCVSDWVHPEDTMRVRTALAELIEEPGGALAVECRLGHADGGWRDVEIAARNLCADPDVGGILLNVRDVTERNVLSAQLRH